MPPPIILYDGVCGLCNRLVQFVLKRDRNSVFRFAALQSRFADPILMRHGASPTELETVVVILNHDQTNESLLTRSDAVLFVLRSLGGFWRMLAALGRLLPEAICSAAYKAIARRRYRIFGRHDRCPLPSQETRSRFLDQ